MGRLPSKELMCKQETIHFFDGNDEFSLAHFFMNLAECSFSILYCQVGTCTQCSARLP